MEDYALSKKGLRVNSMPDITKCFGHGCEKKSSCYRFLCAPDLMQSYFSSSPIMNGVCDYYWPEQENPKKKEKKNETEK